MPVRQCRTSTGVQHVVAVKVRHNLPKRADSGGKSAHPESKNCRYYN
jgi:hypothetical protein